MHCSNQWNQGQWSPNLPYLSETQKNKLQLQKTAAKEIKREANTVDMKQGPKNISEPHILKAEYFKITSQIAPVSEPHWKTMGQSYRFEILVCYTIILRATTYSSNFKPLAGNL